MEYRSILIVKPGPDSILTIFKQLNLKPREKFVASVDEVSGRGRRNGYYGHQYSMDNGKVKG